MTYEVVDNFLDPESFWKIKKMMTEEQFPWFYISSVAFLDDIYSDYYFTHIFYEPHKRCSMHWDTILPLIIKINPKALIRIKGNLYPNINENKDNGWHADYDFPHKGAIFYVNTNNGPTVLEDNTEIASVENRILFFDPSKKHKSTHCTDQKIRVNINFNYF